LRQLRAPIAAVKIEVSHTNLVEDLIESLRSSRCDVVRTGERTLEIRGGWPIVDDAAPYELDGYLRVWEAIRGGVHEVRATRVG
jgi:hypothetical protein